MSKEVKVVTEVSCKNSPKSELLRDLTIATARQEYDLPLEWMTDDVSWNIVGFETIEGPAAVSEKLPNFFENNVQELHIDNIITHGKTAALNGKFLFENEKTIEFCHVYTFKSHSKTAKIKIITTYLIEMDE